MDFETRFKEWFEECQKMFQNYLTTTYPNNPHEVLATQDLQKFVRVVTIRPSSEYGSACWAFVAKEDFSNKTLGSVKKGDIFKPASFKQPAKTARGNLYDEHKGMKFMGPYGPAYLK